jgi:hypothetical protein
LCCDVADESVLKLGELAERDIADRNRKRKASAAIAISSDSDSSFPATLADPAEVPGDTFLDTVLQ